MKRTALKNEKGAALIMSYFVLIIFLVFTMGFALANTNELKQSTMYRDSASSFWIAEAGINRFMQNTSLLDAQNPLTLTIGSKNVILSKVDGATRVVTATSTYRGQERSIQIEYEPTPASIFNNTIATGFLPINPANTVSMNLSGLVAGYKVTGPSKLSGNYQHNGFFTGEAFNPPAITNVADQTQTTIKYPDANSSGAPDEFNDFVEFNRSRTDTAYANYNGEYSSEEVLYIPTNDTVNIYPQTSLVGKKMIFVHGATPGAGDVNVWFDSTWAANQNITIVSTGSVNYIQPLQSSSSNSKLNTISWDNYNEGAVLLSTHSGVTYTHASAYYGSIASLSRTNGNVFSNNGINLNLIAVWKEFSYSNPVDSAGNVPPGFKGLVTAPGAGYVSTPSNWKEI